MSLQELLQAIKGEYEVVCKSEKIHDATAFETEKYVVESVAAVDGLIQIKVKENTSIPNDLNAEWVKEHVEKYGVLPNAFDGC